MDPAMAFKWAATILLLDIFLEAGPMTLQYQTTYNIGPSTYTSTTGVSNSIMLGSGATLGVSNEFMINNIHHLNIPALTT